MSSKSKGDSVISQRDSLLVNQICMIFKLFPNFKIFCGWGKKTQKIRNQKTKHQQILTFQQSKLPLFVVIHNLEKTVDNSLKTIQSLYFVLWKKKRVFLQKKIYSFLMNKSLFSMEPFSSNL